MASRVTSKARVRSIRITSSRADSRHWTRSVGFGPRTSQRATLNWLVLSGARLNGAQGVPAERTGSDGAAACRRQARARACSRLGAVSQVGRPDDIRSRNLPFVGRQRT